MTVSVSVIHYIGIILVFLIILLVGIRSGKSIKSINEFSGKARTAGLGIISGTIIGTIVGGASTIGTAQLAYTNGFSAWVFTLGSGIGLIIMAVFYSKKLYNSECKTLPQYIEKEYGKTAGRFVTMLNSLGSFLSIVSQIMSGTALLITFIVIITGNLNVNTIIVVASAIISVIFMMVYVTFGGMVGAGLVGIVKTVLLYVGMAICGIMAITMQEGGYAGFVSTLGGLDTEYFSLIGRGFWTDGGKILSLILGVLTTQTYIQALISGRSLRMSRISVSISAVFVAAMGIPGILVGMYMRVNCSDLVGENAILALPLFILKYVPALPAGIIIGTLLIAAVGTGAGVVLGLSTMIYNDIYIQLFKKEYLNPRKALLVSRLIIVIVLSLTCIVAIPMIILKAQVQDISTLSMALRGAAAFMALFGALFLTGKLRKEYAIISIIATPLLVLFSKPFIPEGIDSLWVGFVFSAAVMVIGLIFSKYYHKNHQSGDNVS
ncbi:MAG: sodium:solute symporter family protein [Anaerovoracaceae bacterium]|jgi:SSS family solute:Na+ symporter